MEESTSFKPSYCITQITALNSDPSDLNLPAVQASSKNFSADSSGSTDDESGDYSQPVAFSAAASMTSESDSFDQEPNTADPDSSLKVTFAADRSQRSDESFSQQRLGQNDSTEPRMSQVSASFSGQGTYPYSGAGAFGHMQHNLPGSVDRSWFGRGSESHFDSSNILLKRRKVEQGNSKDHPVLPPCNCSRLRCSEKMTEDERQKINEAYWGLKSLTKRRQWMLDHMQRQLINITCKKWLGKKSESRTFYFPDQFGQLFRVCKDFFLRTLGFQCDSTLKALSYSTPLTSNVAAADQRGRRPRTHSITDEVKDLVKKHIHSKLESSQFKMEFNSLRSKVNGCGFVQMCYNDFETCHGGENVSYQAYQDFFVEHSKDMAKAGTLKASPTDFSLLKDPYFDYQNQMYRDALNDFAGNSSSGFDGGIDRNPQLGPQNARDFLAFFERETGQSLTQFADMQGNDSSLLLDNEDNSDSFKKPNESGDRDQWLRQDKGAVFPSVGEKRTHSQSCGEAGSSVSGLSPRLPESNMSAGKLANKRMKEEHPIRPGCSCDRECFSKIDDERRKEIHNLFWSLSDYPKREQWILKQRVLVRQTTISLNPRHTKEMQCYFLPDKSGKQIRVCRLHFMSTLGFGIDDDGTSMNPSYYNNGLPPLRKHEMNRTAYIEQHIQGYIHSGKSIPGLKREDCVSPWEHKVTIKEMHQDFLRNYPFLTASYGTYYKLYNEQVNAFKAELFSGSGNAVSEKARNHSQVPVQGGASVKTGDSGSSGSLLSSSASGNNGTGQISPMLLTGGN
ncbi:uncharacterized protein LOC101845632 [Aplysia californica]|uniref:Uncharacterized protein LOC101845632 n=1 Tax=Aplysia californica TaxID=6500 RepID=A0ABM0JWT8_APLCA|nr:uncharacterized protein LOC101845632 [Aplysia californica]XP_005103396.1 uncharacterized protein LOC101845632 [Aplysia californica]